jgi:hypothetical protein
MANYRPLSVAMTMAGIHKPYGCGFGTFAQPSKPGAAQERTLDAIMDSGREDMGLLRLLSTFWGVGLLILLATYSVLQAVNETPADGRPAGPGNATIARQATPSASFASYVPPASYPEVERETVVLNLACGADDVRSGGGGAGRYPITMRFDQVPDDIRSLLSGADTVFPKDARITMTPCIRDMIDRGELP